jgi:hypothetical protein
MKKLLLLVFFLLAIGTASAFDLGDYPVPFVADGSFVARIVVGASSPAGDTLAATTIATSLQQLVQGEKLTALLDTEIINPYAENLILVGDCDNTLIAEVKGQSRCYQNLAEGTGALELFYYNDVNILIIGGRDAEGRRKAASALAKYKDLRLSGETAEVTGTISFPKVSSQKILNYTTMAVTQDNEDDGVVVTTTPEEEQPTPSCLSDNECNSTEFCSQFGCLPVECPAGFTASNHTCGREVKEPAKILDEVTPDINMPLTPQRVTIFQKFISWIKGLFK